MVVVCQCDHAHEQAVEAILLCQSRSLFIRTMTVGPGIQPGLLTLRADGVEPVYTQALAG